MPRDQDRVNLLRNSNALQQKDVAALAVFWLAGVVTCDLCEGIFQVSQEQEQEEGSKGSSSLAGGN